MPNRRLLMIQKPLWNLGRQTAGLWRFAGRTWAEVMGFLSLDAPSLTILCLYAAGGAIALFRWPGSREWLGLHRTIDVVLLSIFFLWALMFLVWTHEQVQEKVIRWVPACLAAPLWIGPFLAFFGLLAVLTVVMLAVYLLLTPLGGVTMLGGMVYSWWRRRHGITLRCTRRDCPSGKNPFRDLKVRYACKTCGTRYDYLIPSYFGLRAHHCTCGTKLPLGHRLRGTLDKYCPNGHPLTIGSDALPTQFIALVGGKSTGKTCYVRMAIEELLKLSGGDHRFKADFDSEEHRRSHEAVVGLIARGWRPSPTKTDEQEAMVLRLRGDQPKEFRLYLYDAAGEIYSKFTEFHFFGDLTGILVLVDPLASPRLREEAMPAWEGCKVSKDPPVETVFAALMHNVRRYLRYGPSGRTDIPLAVIISKADVKEVKEKAGALAIEKAVGGRQVSATERHDIERRLCREALAEWGMERQIKDVEGQFRRVGYFSCSSLGRIPDDEGRPPNQDGPSYQAERVLPPLQWLLESESARSRQRQAPRHRKVLRGRRTGA